MRPACGNKLVRDVRGKERDREIKQEQARAHKQTTQPSHTHTQTEAHTRAVGGQQKGAKEKVKKDKSLVFIALRT